MVIENYVNKKSGNVTIARDEIKRRFFGLDWTDQQRILSAFLQSGKTDRQWAYSQLLELWDDTFQPMIQELWETHREQRCAWVVIRHFPLEYLEQHIQEFDDEGDYSFICRRLAAKPDFYVDKQRLSKTHYLMVLAHNERHITDAEATDLLYAIVQDLCFHWHPSLELSSRSFLSRDVAMGARDFRSVSLALYYLDKLGKYRIVEDFLEWEQVVRADVQRSPEYRALSQKSLSDHDYNDELAVILQRYLYYALPQQYKTLTDEEFRSKSEQAAGGQQTLFPF